jgi:glutathione synthase/RimK-type ligase-like ATP-grasp enzyme
MIAIHNSKAGFHPRWIAYCEERGIPIKLVNCYANDIIQQLENCDALMWHHSQNDPKALLTAKRLMFALEHSGKLVFPDFKTNWHFDDKVGQKYLLEAIGCPMPESYVFYSKREALNWARTTNYPKVFKLARGAGSFNVRLINNYFEAKLTIQKCFGRGFSNFDALAAFYEGFRKYKTGMVGNIEMMKLFARLFLKPSFAKIIGREVGYAYFQEFIPDNTYDVRVIVIGKKAFAIKRIVRKNDFRASGSGQIEFGKGNFDEGTISIAFSIAEKLGTQCVAFDFVYKEAIPLVVEISYGYAVAAYDPCEGYWDRNLNWHESKFDSCHWMVEVVLEEMKKRNEA